MVYLGEAVRSPHNGQGLIAVHRRTIIIALLLLSIVLGALREFLVLNLNYQIDFVQHGRTVSYAHSIFQGWTVGWSLGSLVVLKWALAMAFALLMCVLSLTLARVLFGDHRYALLIVLGFVGVGAVATVLHFTSGLVPAFAGVSIKLLHLLQYPVLLFFIWAASLLATKRS